MSSRSIIAYLQRLPYFASLPADALQALIQYSIKRNYQQGELIFLEGDVAAGLYLILDGSVKVYKLSAEGDEQILHILAKGEVFNVIAAFDGGVNPAHAMALTEVSLWLIPTEHLTAFMCRYPECAVAVVRSLAARVRYLVTQIEDLTLYSVRVRLARFLLRQSEDIFISGQGVTRAAIAAYLNTTPQTLSSTLKELAVLGVIRFDRQKIYIIDEYRLKQIALL